MARPGRPERNRATRSFRQLRRFHHGINWDKVFHTHNRRKYVLSSKVGKLLKASRRNHAIREIKRTMRRPRRQVATSETERRPMLISQPPPCQTGVYQHTNSITSDEHEVAIHSEDLTR